MKIIKYLSFVAAALVVLMSGVSTAALPDNFSVSVSVSGVTKTLVLSRHSVRTSQCRIMTWDSVNSYVTVHDELGVKAYEVRTYRGHVSQNPNEYVTAVVLPSGELRAEGHSGKGELWSISGVDVSHIVGASVPLEQVSEPDEQQSVSAASEEPAEAMDVLGTQRYMPPVTMYRADAVFDIPSQFYNKSSYGNGDAETTAAVFENQLNILDLFNSRDAMLNIDLSEMVIRKEQFYFPEAGDASGFNRLLRNTWLSIGRNPRAFIASLFPYNFTYAGGYASGSNFYNTGGEPICVNALYHENAHNWGASHYYYGRDTMNGSHRHHGELNVQRVLYNRQQEIDEGDLDIVTNYPTELHPYATLDLATTLVDTAVDIPVLANDWDANGDALSVGYYTQNTVQNGTVTLSSNVLTYTPASGYVGKDIIVYESQDTAGLYTIGLVHVEVINRGLAAFWAFEETSGTTAADSSGNGHNGKLVTSNFSYDSVTGVIGNAVVVSGNKGMICDAGDIIAEAESEYPLEARASNFFDPMDEDFSVAFWFKANDMSSTITLLDKGNKASFGYSITANEGSVTAKIREWEGLSSGKSVTAAGAFPDTWCHVAMVIDRSSNKLRLYVNGQQASTSATLTAGSFIFEGRTDLIMGTDQWNGGPAVDIAFDELYIFTKPLTAGEIAILMSGAELPAGAPVPANGAINVYPETDLSWQAGKVSYQHDVYFGTNFESVANASTSSPEYMGRFDTAVYQPTGVEPQTNCFWRIDEVDGALIVPGDVWTFTTARSSIVGYLKLHATLDTADISGTTVYDTAYGETFDGTIVGSLANPVGKIGECLDFPKSTSDYVDFGQGLDPGIYSLSASVWFKLDTVDTVQYIITKGNNSNSTEPGFSIWVRNDGLIEFRGNHVGSATGTRFSRHKPAGTIVAGQWYHAVTILDRETGTIRAYLNGSQVTSTYTSTTLTEGLSVSSTEPLVIGTRPGGFPVDGLIDDVGVWARALTEDEVVDIYNKGINGQTFHQPPVPIVSTSFEASEGFTGTASTSETFLMGTVTDSDSVLWTSPNGAKIWDRSDIPPDGVQCLVLGLSNTTETCEFDAAGDEHGVGMVTFEYASFSSSTNAVISLEYNAGSGWIEAWSKQVTGSNPNWSSKPWPGISIAINVPGDVALRFKKVGTKGALIDKVVVTDRPDYSTGTETPGISSCNFESGFVEWTNVDSDSYDWTLNQGDTPSGNTGPDHDNTLGNVSGTYAYMETSNNQGAYNAGDIVVLESDAINATNYTDLELSFYYHMFGENIGTLNVDVYDDVWHEGVWSISGQQHGSSGQVYSKATVDLSGYSDMIKIRIRAVAAGGFAGDLAIDDIVIAGTEIEGAPLFNNPEFDSSDAIEGMNYSGTLDGTAAAGEPTDVLAYTKTDGPTWLAIADNGDMSGIAGDSDVGANEFIVRVTNQSGLFDEAAMTVTVLNTYTGEKGIDDVQAMASHWLESGCVDVPPCSGADITGDNAVDFEDYAKLALGWL